MNFFSVHKFSCEDFFTEMPDQQRHIPHPNQMPNINDKDKTKYGSLDIDHQSTVVNEASSIWLWVNFILCIIVGPLNFVFYKVMYSAYGDSRAYFVSQGVNFLYVLYGGIIIQIGVYRGMMPPEKDAPHIKFIIMGFLDCLGGFLAAMGANQTSGSLQQLLNQTLIPITMVLSWIILGKKSTALQISGSLFIIMGAAIVIMSSNSSSTDDTTTGNGYSWSFISNLIYFSSNIPIGFSCVYKELGFRDLQMHVMYMTQWVSIYQLLWGFVLGFLQLIPGMGSLNGVTVNEMRSSFYSGVLCFLHVDQECADRNTFTLLTGYCLINFLFNIVGLNLVKYDSAVLSNLTSALVLPLTVLMFSMPMLGAYREPCSSNIIAGLVAVMFGFLLWRLKHLPFTLVCCIPSSSDDRGEEEGEGGGMQDNEGTEMVNTRREALTERENVHLIGDLEGERQQPVRASRRTGANGVSRRERDFEAASCGCGMVYTSIPREEGRGEGGGHVESFSDRVIFLSLDE